MLLMTESVSDLLRFIYECKRFAFRTNIVSREISYIGFIQSYLQQLIILLAKTSFLDIHTVFFLYACIFFSGVRSIRGLSITVKCAARDDFTGNSANWIAPYISIQQMKIDSDALPLITARRIATVI